MRLNVSITKVKITVFLIRNQVNKQSEKEKKLMTVLYPEQGGILITSKGKGRTVNDISGIT